MTGIEELIRATAGHRLVLGEIARRQRDTEQIARGTVRAGLA